MVESWLTKFRCSCPSSFGDVGVMEECELKRMFYINLFASFRLSESDGNEAYMFITRPWFKFYVSNE